MVDDSNDYVLIIFLLGPEEEEGEGEMGLTRNLGLMPCRLFRECLKNHSFHFFLIVPHEMKCNFSIKK